MVVSLWLLLAGCVDPDAVVDPTDNTEIVFEVKKGSAARSLAAPLAESGLIAGESTWTWYMRSADGSCVKAGKFSLRKSMSLKEILETLCGPPIADDEPFTVVEGWRIVDIDKALVDKGWIEPGEYAEIARNKSVTTPFVVSSSTLEGFLYPETYKVPPGDRFDPKKLIERQLGTFQERFLAVHGENLGGHTLDEVVIMASMLEREERVEANRPLVAGILWKRIDHGWQLGVDATSRYPLDDWNDEKTFLAHLRDPADPYNTRIHKGLPPTAIGNPTLTSLEAAIQPAESEWWFYLHDAQGRFHGARNGQEHDANRARYNVY